MSVITEESQKFSPSNMVVLYELDCTILGGSILRFTGSQESASSIIFNGNEYFPVPVEVSGFEISTTGAPGTPIIKILNIPSLQAGVISLKDLIGSTLTRIRTFKTFLDDGDTPDPTAYYPLDIYTIDRKSNQNKVFIEWELAAATNQQGRQIPGRQVLKDFCTHIYRTFDSVSGTFNYTKATCPYTGAACFNLSDNVDTPAADTCGKRLSSCKIRFGETAELPTRAFPGIAPL